MIQQLSLARCAALGAVVVLAGTGCSKGGSPGGGETPQVTLTAAEMAGFKKTDVSGKRGGTILDAVFAGPKTFNMLIAGETSSTGAVGVMFPGLLTRNAETLKIEPELAESYQQTNGGRTWTFKLRPGLKWSDGQPFTADDVTFTLDLIYDTKIETPQRELMLLDGKPWQYKKVDEQTVRIDLPAPFGPFLDIAGFPILPKHKLNAAWKEGKFNSTWGVDTPATELVGMGPLLLQKYDPGQRLLYRRNPYYWKLAADGTQLPFLDSQVTQVVPDMNTVNLKFKSKETDTIDLSPQDWAGMKAGEAEGGYHALNLGPSWGSNYVVLNQNPRASKLLAYKREWFAKKEFRQAISYAINRKSMIETVFRGLARPQWSPVSEANKVFYNAKVKQYPYDPARAKSLLAGLGFRDKNGDGILEDPAGHAVEFSLLTNTGNNVRSAMSAVIQDDLKQVGINLHLTPIEFNNLVTRLMNTYDWEAILLGFTGGPEPHSGASIWTSRGPMHGWNPRQAKAATPWEAQIDQLFSQGAKTVDPVKRKAIYDQWQQIASEELPLIFLVTPDSLAAIRDRLGNMKPTSLSRRWNIEELYIK
jgi:peptide/nickel transport system substrate-binding protein